MLCEQGEDIYVDFGSHRGHEPTKYRTALVLSASDFNSGSSMTVPCPITSSDAGYPFHVYIDSGQVVGYACVEQTRALDLGARRCRRAGWAEVEGWAARPRPWGRSSASGRGREGRGRACRGAPRAAPALASSPRRPGRAAPPAPVRAACHAGLAQDSSRERRVQATRPRRAARLTPAATPAGARRGRAPPAGCGRPAWHRCCAGGCASWRA